MPIQEFGIFWKSSWRFHVPPVVLDFCDSPPDWAFQELSGNAGIVSFRKFLSISSRKDSHVSSIYRKELWGNTGFVSPVEHFRNFRELNLWDDASTCGISTVRKYSKQSFRELSGNTYPARWCFNLRDKYSPHRSNPFGNFREILHEHTLSRKQSHKLTIQERLYITSWLRLTQVAEL